MFGVYGPLIRGSQFLLRPPRLDEAELMTSWFEDQEVTDYFAIRLPMTVQAERDWLQRIGDEPNIILWAIEHEGRIVGTTSIGAIDWQHQNAVTGTLIGDKTAWGKGIAGEMMRLRADYAFTQLPLRKLKSAYLAGNEASRRAQEGAGYREVGRLREDSFRDGVWIDRVLTELYRDEWERRRRA